jgi:YD repeat-containing protein
MVAIVSGNGFGLATGSSATLGQSGIFGNPNLGNSGEAAFINVANGNLVLRDQDEFVAALGVNLPLTRTYNSLGNYQDGNGANWKVGSAKQVANLTGTLNTAGSTVTRIDSDGSAQLYTYDTSLGRYRSSDGAGGYNTLSMNSYSEWVWTSDRLNLAGLHEVYDSTKNAGHITATRDQTGVRLSYQYNAAGQLSQVTDASGDQVYYDYANGNLSQVGVTTAAGATTTRTRYAYDGQNRLTSVVTDLTPDDNSVADGNTYSTTYTYVGNTSQVASVVQGDGTALSFTYTLVDGVSKIDTVTDGLGQKTTFSYAAGQTTVTDPLHYATVYAYDAAGQLLSVTAPAVNGVSQVTAFNYDAKGNVLTVTDPRGKVTTYVYDANGNRIKGTNAAGDVVTRVYDLASNNLLSETQSPDGTSALTTNYVYDAGNRPRFVISPEGRVQEITYNTQGQRASMLEYSVALLPVGTPFTETAIAAWANALPLSSSTANRVLYSYDARGLVSKTSSDVVTRQPLTAAALPATVPAGITRDGNNLTFTSTNQPATSYPGFYGVGSPLGTEIKFEVVTPAVLFGSMVNIGIDSGSWPSDGQRLRVQFKYNGMYLQLQQGSAVSYPYLGPIKANTTYVVELVTQPSGEALMLVYEKGSDRSTARTQGLTFPLGSSIRFAGETVSGPSYGGSTTGASTTIAVNNIMSRPPVATATPAVTAQYVYDQHGRLMQSIDGNNKTSASFTYDALGRQLTATDALGNVSLTTYNDPGRTVLLTQANGLFTTNSYDAAGRLTLSMQTLGGVTRQTNSYDADGRLRMTETMDGNATYYLYDAAGRQSARIDASGNLTAYYYNADNQVTRTVQYARTVNAAQLKDANGNWRELSVADLNADATGSRSSWNEYDAAGRLAATVDATGSVTRYQYDHAGRLTAVIRRAKAIDPATLATAYAAASIADTASPDDLIDRNYYDKDGKLRAEVDAQGILTEHRYDAQGQRIETIVHQTALTPAYLGTTPALDQLIATSGGVASHERYFYGVNGQLAGTLDNGNYLTELKYDLNGNVSSRRHYAVAVSAPGAARMADLGYATGDADLLTSYTYTVRNQLATETAPGGIVTRYSYDNMGQLIETRVGLGSGTESAQARQYDLKGNVTAELSAEGAALLTGSQQPAAEVAGIWQRYGTSYTYNSNNLRLSATDPNGNKTRYYYDALGNLIRTVNALGEVAALAYNAFGQVVSKTTYATRIDAVTLAALNGAQNNADALQVIDSIKSSALDTTQSFEYDGDGHLTATVDALKNRSTIHYDVFGRADATEQQNVPGTNTPAPATDPGARSFYDADGRLAASLTSGGSLTAYSYNALGQLTDRITYSKPVAFDITAAGMKTLLADPSAQRDTAHDLHQRYFYDARGLLAATMTAEELSGGQVLWSVVRNTYDGNGNLLTRTAYANKVPTADSLPAAASYPADNAADSIVAYAYDSANRLLATATAQNAVNPSVPGVRNWSVVRNSYDAIGRLAMVTAYATAKTGATPTATELGSYKTASTADAVTCYTYDTANRIKTVATAQGAAVVNGVTTVQWAVTERTYDAMGQLRATTQYATAATTASLAIAPAGILAKDAARDRVTAFDYDAAGRLAGTTDAEGGKTLLVYDAKGNLIQRTAKGATPADDRVSRSYYDLDNRLQFSVDAAGDVTEQRYDAQGNVAATVRYAKPVAAGQLTELASSLTSKLSGSADDRATTYVYDQNHRLRFTLDARGYATENRYDSFGRLSDTLAYPTRPALADTSLANLVRNTGAFGAPRIAHLDYDAQGNLVKSTDAMGYSESYGYDALGHKISFTNKLNQTWTYAYDSAGHLVLETTPEIDVYANGQLDVNTDWTTRTPVKARLQTYMQYDTLGNLTSRIEGYGSGQARVTVYGYDLVGRQILTSQPSVAVYNAGEVASSTGAAARNEVASGTLTVEVTYDMLGNAVANKDVGGNMSYKVYDRLGQVRYDIDAAGYVTGYVHDSFGAVTALTRYNEPLPGYAGFKASAANRTQKAVGDSLQARAAAVAGADRTIATRYDQLGQAVKVTEPLAWVFDQHALNGASMFMSARTTDTSYDAFGEARQVTVYGADASGKALTSAASTRYYYDAAGNVKARISALQDDAGGRLGYLTTFDYNAAGDLQVQTEYATAYSDWRADWQDTYYGVPQSSGTDRVTTTYYDDNRRKLLVTRDGAISASYGYDRLGNATAVSDGGGNTTYSYFDVLGRVTGTATMHYALPWMETAPGTSLPAAPTPLTEFRRDLYGNVVMRIDYANGVPAGTTADLNPFAANAANPPTRAPGLDRITSTTYDSAGRAIQVFDAENKAINTSYDKFGRVAKQWRTVSNADNADHQVETSFIVTRYDALGHVQATEKPGNIDLIHGDLNQRNTIESNTYNAFGEVTQTQIVGANQYSTDDWASPKVRTYYTRYDNAGHAWLSNTGDGVDKVMLFDAQGNVSSSIVSVDPDMNHAGALPATADVRAALQVSSLQRTDYSFDLMGRQVDARASSDAQLYVMVRDPLAGAWYKMPQLSGSKLLDSLLVVADARDQGTPFTMYYRLQGGAWIDGGTRLQSVGGATVFSTQGLPAGGYEYQVTAQPAGEAAFVRSHGSMQIANTPSKDKNITVARIYALLLNRAPDLGGLNFYVARANEGVSMASIVLGFLASTEAAPNLAGTSEAVIKRIFSYAFGRDGANPAADPSYAADIAKWSVAYDRAKAAGGAAPGQMFLDLIDAVVLPVDEYLPPATKAPLYQAQTRLNNRVEAGLSYVMDYSGVNKDSAAAIFNEAAGDLAKARQDAKDLGTLELQKTQIARMYLTLFGRAPDVGGVAFWLNALKTITPEQMASGMLDSPEAKDPLLYPDNDLDEAGYNQQLIAHAYQNMLGRAPTAPEKADWTNRFAAMSGTAKEKRGKFVMQLAAQVGEYGGTDSALLAQKLAFNNKVAIALNFGQAALGNIPLADQVYINRAVFAAVTSAETAKAAAEKAETTLAASATAMAAMAAAARAAAGAMPLEDMRAQVTRLYVALLNRTPDSAGLAFYLDAYQRLGGGPDAWTAIANGLINSDESRADTSLTAYTPVNGAKTATTDAQFVQRIYQLALGKLPTSGAAQQEMLAFQQQLTASNRGEIAVKIINSLLSYPDPSAADAALKATFNNKVGVALACVVNLSAFDWANAGNIGVARSTLDKVTATDIHAALDYAYGLAQAAATKPTIDAATQAKASVATSSAAAAASALAKDNVSAATTLAAAQPTAAQRLQLMQMYTGLLGRTPAQYSSKPDLGGLEFYIDALTRTTMDAVASGFISSDEGLKIYPAGMSNADFVAKVYATILGGATPVPDAAAWVAKLGGATPMTRGQVALGILDAVKNYVNYTPDANARNYLAARQAFYQRVADNFALVDTAQQAAVSAANAALVDQNALAATLPGLLTLQQRDAAAQATAASDATTALSNANSAGNGSANRRLQLTLLYATLLQRAVAPTQGEFDFFVTGNGGAADLVAVAQSFIISKEAVDRSLFPADNRAFISTLYSYILGRTPDASEIDYWLPTLSLPNGRGQVAIFMLNSYNAYSDSRLTQLQRKVGFDQTINGFINQENTDAAGIASTALATLRQRQGETGTASQNLTTAKNLVTSTKAAVDLITADANKDYYYADMFRAAPSTYQSSITYVYLGIRGSVDFPGLAWQMTNANGSAAYRTALINALLNEANNGYPADPVAFVQKLFLKVLGRAASATDGGVLFYADYLRSNPSQRTAVAEMILNSSEAAGHLNPLVSTQVAADISRAKQLVDKRSAANTAYANAQNQLPGVQSAYDTAAGRESAAGTAYTAAANAAAAVAALKTAYAKTLTADSAYVTAAQSRDAYAAAKTRYDTQQIVLAPQIAIVQGAPAATPADHAGAVLAARLAALAAADTGVASAYAADAALAPAARQTRQVTQLYVALANRAPQLAELRFWNGKLAEGMTLANVAKGIMESSVNAGLYPPTMNNDAFVTQLYKFGLARDFSKDPGGLRFWSDKLGGTTPMSRAELAAAWSESVPANNNNDSVTLDNKVIAALQAVITEGNALAITPGSLAPAIQLAEETARSTAATFDASAKALLASTPMAQYFQPVTRLYLALLNRAPDTPGVPFWINAIVNSAPPLTMGQVAQSMLASPEAQQRYPAGTSDSAFLTQVFTNAMGRAPTAAELNPYLAQVAGQGRGAAAANMINAIADGSASGDLELTATRDEFNAKVDAAMAGVAKALTDQARYLDQAVKVAHDMAASNPVNLHVDGVVMGVAAAIQGGEKTAAVNAVTLDRWGNVLNRIDARDPNWSVTYTYNHDNQVLTQTQFAKAGDPPKYAQRYTYDALGHVTSVTEGADPAVPGSGHTNRNYYDANGNLVKEVHADGGVIDYQLDVFGQRTSVWQYTDADNAVKTDYRYDRLGRQTRHTTAEVAVAYWSTDSTVLTWQRGQITDTYAYDELGRRIRSTNSNNAGVLDPNNGLSTLTRYDLGGNIISVESGVAANREAGAPRRATLSAYDAFNGKFGELDYGGTIVEQAQPGGAHNYREWVLDDNGRTVNYIDLSGMSTYYTYDAAGKMVYQGTAPSTTAPYQNIHYTYDNGTGALLQIDDRTLHQVTSYTYDRDGNRLTENVWLAAQSRALQDNTLSYDHQGRLTDIVSTVVNADYKVHYEYDDYGNRKGVDTTFTNDAGDKKHIWVSYDYDSMNRQTSVSGGTQTEYGTPRVIGNRKLVDDGDDSSSTLDNSVIAAHAITYDWLGNRKTDNQDVYRYDEAGRLSQILTNNAVTGQRWYDGSGQVISSTDKDGIHFNNYDDMGHLEDQRNTDASGKLTSKLHYQYDTAGNLYHYAIVGADNRSVQMIDMEYGAKHDGYLLTTTTISNLGTSGPVGAKSSVRHYDVNGHLSEVTGEDARTVVNDSAGHILEKTQGGAVTHSLLANDQLIGSSSRTFESFSSVYDSVNSPSVAAPPSVYVVQGADETLRSVAKMVWGDERLWYLIGDVNGMSSADAKLSVSLPLKIPTRVNTVLNGYQSFKPYDASAALGSTTPELAMPQAPQSGGGGCGGLGTLIMVVVAVAVTIYTAGAMSGVAGGFLNTMAAGASALGGGVAVGGVTATAAGFTGGAIAGAVGSIASQAVGNMIGAQDGFNWTGVALSALGAGISSGVAQFGQAAGSSSIFNGQGWTATAARATLSNAISQGTGMITGMQSGFDWRGVAASAAGSLAGSMAGDAARSVLGAGITASTISGVTSGVMASAMHGGRINLAQIATDAFGNALVESLTSMLDAPPATVENPEVGGPDKEYKLKNAGQGDPKSAAQGNRSIDFGDDGIFAPSELINLVASKGAQATRDQRAAAQSVLYNAGFALGDEFNATGANVGANGQWGENSKAAANKFLANDKVNTEINQKMTDFFSGVRDEYKAVPGSDGTVNWKATGNKYVDYVEGDKSVRLKFLGKEIQPTLDLSDVLRETDYQVYQAAGKAALATGGIFELGINSTYRVPTGGTSPHPLGKAIDVLYITYLPDEEAGPHTLFLRDTQNKKLDYDIKDANVNFKTVPNTYEEGMLKSFSNNLFSMNPGVVSQVLQPWRMAERGSTSWRPNNGGNGAITKAQNPDNWLDALHRNHLHISINPGKLWNVY